LESLKELFGEFKIEILTVLVLSIVVIIILLTSGKISGGTAKNKEL